MQIKLIFELIGYAASFLVAVSLMMSSVIRLRLINLGGAICFVIYGLFLGAYPIALVNLIIIGINLYYLYQIYSAKEYFTLLEVKHDAEYLARFLQFHAREIQTFRPDFTYLPSEQSLIFFILRDMVPAGLFIADARGGGALWVHLDFVIPGYRDFKIGRFLFEQKAAFFKDRDIRKIYSASGNPAHTHYLRQMGFVPDASDTTGVLYSHTIS